MSRSLLDLHPEVRWRAKNLKQSAQLISIPIVIHFTLRTSQEQNALFEQGRGKPGPMVTNVRGGFSYHNYGLAFDFAMLKPGQTIDWNVKTDINADEIPDYEQVGELGEDLGLQWGGRFKSIRGDVGHLQMSFGFMVSQLMGFYKLGGLIRVWAEVDKVVEDGVWP